MPNRAPTARRHRARRPRAAVPLTVNFDGTRSSDPNPGDTLSYAWDLDGDGAFDDSTSATPSRTYTTPAAVTVAPARHRPRRPDRHRHVTDHRRHAADRPRSTRRRAGTTWQVGDTIALLRLGDRLVRRRRSPAGALTLAASTSSTATAPARAATRTWCRPRRACGGSFVGSRPRVPVVPRAPAHRDRRRRPARRSRAGSTRGPCRSRCESEPAGADADARARDGDRAVHARRDPGLALRDHGADAGRRSAASVRRSSAGATAAPARTTSCAGPRRHDLHAPRSQRSTTPTLAGTDVVGSTGSGADRRQRRGLPHDRDRGRPRHRRSGCGSRRTRRPTRSCSASTPTTAASRRRCWPAGA